MQGLVRLIAFVAFAFGASALPLVANAQDNTVVKQVKLTEQQVQGFIAAQKDMSAMADKVQGDTADKPDPKVQAELESIAKKHGFASFDEYDDVAANVSLVMAGIDPQTGAFTDPVTAIKKEIDEITADKTIPDKDKKQMLEELAEAQKTTQPIQFPENIELVKKYREQIDAVLQ
ncbi:MAG: hypothetical protein AB7K67_07215 [Hyphomicrobiaceae bacterium]|jgi:hypothetical protein